MTLYTGESAEAALAEVLAPFRPDLDAIAQINEIPCDDDKSPAAGKVPKQWLAERRIAQAKIRSNAIIVDISSTITIQALRNEPVLAKQALISGFNDLDDSALKASAHRGRFFTQKVAAFIYNAGNTGIRYESRLGSQYTCIAGFVALSAGNAASSKFLEQTMPSEMLSPLDPVLQHVSSIFSLKLPYTIV